jgi:parallel beta-helix repeat protein
MISNTSDANIKMIESSNNNTIYGNSLVNKKYSRFDMSHGIDMEYYSSDNLVQNNYITDVLVGISLFVDCNRNTFFENTIRDNYRGIIVGYSVLNIIYHNNFINNYGGHALDTRTTNLWDNGFPSGGNYWSDYTERYPDAHEIDDSGIWDTPYEIPGEYGGHGVDNFPFMDENGWIQ